MLCIVCTAEETEYFYYIGSKLFASGNYTGALAYFDTAIKKNPNYVDAWIKKGDTQRVLKDYNESVKSYSHALQIDNKSMIALRGLIDSYLALKDNAKASLFSANLTELDPKNRENWFKEGNLLQSQGEYAESLSKYDGALELDPNYKDALFRKGLSLIALGQTTEAISIFNALLNLDPKYKQAYVALGLAFEAENRSGEALDAYDEALHLGMHDSIWTQALIGKMNTLLTLKRTQESAIILVGSQ